MTRLATAALLSLLAGYSLTGCSLTGDPDEATSSPSAGPTEQLTNSATSTPEVFAEPPGSTPPIPSEPPFPVSLPAYFDRTFSGGGLRLGAVRDQTPAYTSYAASYRSGSLRVTGVLNVPAGAGPFPAVVLAHGYIDPNVYVSGQGMTRERGVLAARGYVALHVDYRNHAGSDDDPDAARELRMGYAVDVVNAVHALRAARQVPVADDKVALLGRSMGGGVIYKVLEMAPGLVGTASVWAPVSSLEAENFDRWVRGNPARDELTAYVARRYGLPGETGSGRFWREISARTYFERITEPLLIVQGGRDDTCPPRWARASYRALRAARVPARLAWYADEQHAFGPQFTRAMDRTIGFFDRTLNVEQGY